MPHIIHFKNWILEHGKIFQCQLSPPPLSLPDPLNATDWIISAIWWEFLKICPAYCIFSLVKGSTLHSFYLYQVHYYLELNKWLSFNGCPVFICNLIHRFRTWKKLLSFRIAISRKNFCQFSYEPMKLPSYCKRKYSSNKIIFFNY